MRRNSLKVLANCKLMGRHGQKIRTMMESKVLTRKILIIHSLIVRKLWEFENMKNTMRLVWPL